MFRRLIINTALSVAAFLTISVVGLLLTPLIVRTYGLAAYGLVTLARLFLPTGVLALVDLGLSEVAIQVVARAREDRDWRAARAQLTLLGLTSIALGVVAAALLALGAGALTELLKTPPELSHELVRVLLFTAAALPILFVSLGAEGVLKGFERYDAVRGLEVGATVLYAGLTIAAVLFHGSFEQVCLGYVLAQALRALVAIALAATLLGRHGVYPTRWTQADRQITFDRSGVLTYGRLIGSLQGQAPPMLISAIFGPAATGVYDILTRLPKFMKSVLGLISSTLLPVAVRLDVSNNTEGTRRLGETGLLMMTLITLPVVTACMFFSLEILQLWIGPQMASDWPWLALMFLQPLIMAPVGFGSSILLGRLDITRRLNTITTFQVLLQLGISLALAGLLQEKAFILGQVIAVCVTFPVSMALITRSQGLTSRIYLWLAQGVMVGGSLALLFNLIPRPGNAVVLATYGAIWAALAGAALWTVSTTADERKSLLRILSMLVPQRMRNILGG
jgi:O-antigen/teichoic acid export membrane protein